MTWIYFASGSRITIQLVEFLFSHIEYQFNYCFKCLNIYIYNFILSNYFTKRFSVKLEIRFKIALETKRDKNYINIINSLY